MCTRADVGDAVQGLRPPLVTGNPEAGHRRGLVHQEPYFFLQCEPLHQVRHPLLRPVRRVAEAVAPQGGVRCDVAGEDGGLAGDAIGAQETQEAEGEEEQVEKMGFWCFSHRSRGVEWLSSCPP
ncbi:hypothetical protein GW17_00025761 [Ensete ventricosum]|nr:hypothetical protein GW17_00025761 [Ensete ventricosum]